MNTEIIHHVPGRCRIRLPQQLAEPEFAAVIPQMLQQLKYVTCVRLNLSANSLVIGYSRRVEPKVAEQQILATLTQLESQLSDMPIPLSGCLAATGRSEQTDKPERLAQLGITVLEVALTVSEGLLPLPVRLLLAMGVVYAAAFPTDQELVFAPSV